MWYRLDVDGLGVFYGWIDDGRTVAALQRLLDRYAEKTGKEWLLSSLGVDDFRVVFLQSTSSAANPGWSSSIVGLLNVAHKSVHVVDTDELFSYEGDNLQNIIVNLGLEDYRVGV